MAKNKRFALVFGLVVTPVLLAGVVSCCRPTPKAYKDKRQLTSAVATNIGDYYTYDLTFYNYAGNTTYFDFDLDDQTNINIVDLPHCDHYSLSNIIRSEKPSFVYIDYCGLIRVIPETDAMKKDREKRVIIICQELSRIAKELDISIVLLMQQARDYEKDKRIEIAHTGVCGFKNIADGIQYSNTIPMFLERSYEKDPEKATIYLFDKEGKYEQYSEFNVKEIYRSDDKKWVKQLNKFLKEKKKHILSC